MLGAFCVQEHASTEIYANAHILKGRVGKVKNITRVTKRIALIKEEK